MARPHLPDPRRWREWVARIAGAGAGLAAGWYGAIIGFLLGYMVDQARLEAAARRRLAAYLGDPGAAAPPEPVPGLAAAAALALGREGGLSPADGSGAARVLFERIVRAEMPLGRPGERELERILDMAGSARPGDLPALARALAGGGAPAVRAVLARCGYELLAEAGSPPRPAAELRLRALLADCGVPGAEVELARDRAFPGYRDPWAVLGLAPGAALDDIKKAYRRLSRERHPDTAARGGPGGYREDPDGAAASGFREIREAYEALSRP